MSAFARWAGLTETTRVLDVGGSALNWDLSPVVPDVTLLNLKPGKSKYREVVGDGIRLPFPSGTFDLVFSNSVIEHVQDPEAFAAELQRVGCRYFVQTPNRRFPFEPHLLAPCVNYLPKRWQARLGRNFTPWGWITRPSAVEVRRFVAQTTLLDREGMKRIFPRGEVIGRRSLIARGQSAIQVSGY